jgi:glutaredoxin
LVQKSLAGHRRQPYKSSKIGSVLTSICAFRTRDLLSLVSPNYGFAEMPRAVLYTRQRCCLCAEAKAILQRHGLSVEEVDIDDDPALRERYNESVPVIEIEGRERFRGRIDERLLARLVRHFASEQDRKSQQD